MPTFDTLFFVEFFSQKVPNRKRKLVQIASLGRRFSTITLHELYNTSGPLSLKQSKLLKQNDFHTW